MVDSGVIVSGDWCFFFIDMLIGYNFVSVWDCFIYGVMYFVLIYVVIMVVGGFWEVLFVVKCGYEVNEGFFVILVLFVLICFFLIFLWQVVLGILFGVVLGKEVFGGIGKNFFNLALIGRVFLFFVYLVSMLGDFVWIVVDGFFGVIIFSVVV